MLLWAHIFPPTPSAGSAPSLLFFCHFFGMHFCRHFFDFLRLLPPPGAQFSTKNRPNLAWLLCRIELREQKEHTGSKITKIDVAPNAAFCWIRAQNYAQIRRRSKIRCPVILGLESLRGRRMRNSGSGGEGFAPFRI